MKIVISVVNDAARVLRASLMTLCAFSDERP